MKTKEALIAPNGKSSNLSPAQYHLVRTPAFKAWFGDWEKDPQNSSKIIDENGEPMIVYHYSNNDFHVFKMRGKIKTYGGDIENYGAYFTPHYDSRVNYLKMKGEYESEVFLSIKKPFVTEDQLYSAIINKQKFDELMQNKSDGVILNRFGQELFSEIIAFYPEQIKLADGSNVTFDNNNPDIRFHSGGITKSSDRNSTYIFYHGTNNPKAIRKNGFKISKQTEDESSFMGDNFANGIYLSKTTDPYEDDGQLADVAEVLKVTTTAKNILKVKGFEGIIKLNKKYKIPEFDDDAAALLTEALKKDGYDGLDIGDELIIFNPKHVQLYEEFEKGGTMSEYDNEYLDYILSGK